MVKIFIQTFSLLTLSNLFMTFAWYGHLKILGTRSLPIVILISWGIAFFEYCLQVPANRIGSTQYTLSQLKVGQEIITMIVFSLFSIYYMKVPLTKNFFIASIFLFLSAYFIFQDSKIS